MIFGICDKSTTILATLPVVHFCCQVLLQIILKISSSGIRELRAVLYVVTSEATANSNVTVKEKKPIILFTFQFSIRPLLEVYMTN